MAKKEEKTVKTERVDFEFLGVDARVLIVDPNDIVCDKCPACPCDVDCYVPVVGGIACTLEEDKQTIIFLNKVTDEVFAKETYHLYANIMNEVNENACLCMDNATQPIYASAYGSLVAKVKSILNNSKLYASFDLED